MDPRWGLHAWFEFSVPRLIRGTNLLLATLDEAVETVSSLYDEAALYVDWAVPASELSLMRIDVVQHFTGVEHPDLILSGVHSAALGTSRLTLYRAEDGTNNVTRTARGRWKARLYDKAQEIESRYGGARGKDRAALRAEVEQARGVLRFEVELRTPVLRRAGVTRLGDLTTEQAQALNERYFRRAGFHHEVGGRMKFRVAAEMAKKMNDYKDFASAVAMLVLESEGLPVPHTSKTTDKKLRQVARKYDLTPADFTFLNDGTLMLDYDSGSLLTEGGDETLS